MKLFSKWCLIVWLLSTQMLFAGNIESKTKKVLVLLSYNITIPWERAFISGLEESIKHNSLDFELYFELIDTQRLGLHYKDELLAQHLKEKYADLSFDAIIAESDKASLFLDQYQDIFTSKLPKVYYLSKHNDIQAKENIFVLSDNKEKIVLNTAQMALKYNRDIENVYVVNGGDLESEFLTKSFYEFFQKYPKINFHRIENFTKEELLQTIQKIDAKSAIFYTLVFKDKTEKEYIPKNILQEICDLSKSPVYSMYTPLLDSGTIGGHMMDSRQIAFSVLEILQYYFIHGKFDKTAKYSFSNSYVDHAVFEKYDLSKSTLDTDTIILNQKPALLLQYKDEIILLTISFLLILILILFIYILNRKNKQKYINETITSQLLLEQQKEIETVKNRFQNMFLNHDAIMLLVDPKTGNILNVNKSAAHFYGFKREEFLKMNISQLNVLSMDEIKKRMQEAKELKHNYFEFPHRLSSGEIKIVEVHSSPIESDGGVILFSIIKDITKLKDLTQELENEKFKYQKLMENSSDAIFIIDPLGVLIEYSHVARESLGYSDEEMKKLCVFDWDKQITKEEFKGLIDTISFLEPISFERLHTRKDGTLYTASITAIKVELDSQQYIYASVRDISPYKKLTKELEDQKQEFETIFNYAEDGITVLDLDGNFVKFNNSFLKLTGYTQEELLGKNCSELTAPEDREKNKLAMETSIKTGHVENFEKTCIVYNKQRITVHVSISLLPDKRSLLMIVKDTSALKLLEEQAKLASMGEMIGNIAHQWRQPLSIISSGASGLKVQVKYAGSVSNEDIEEVSDLIVQQTQYLSNTIDNFRDFLKGDKNYKNIKLDQVLEYTLSLVDASIKNNNITLIKNVDKRVMIRGSINELSEAFINIINNSKDILKEKVQKEEDRLIFIDIYSLHDSHVEILFRDSGGGIPSDIIDRIFEPYFTSKHQSIGTGLGLSMAEKIIRERHQGSIHAFNEEYEYDGKKFKGACFKIVLPTV